MPVHEKSGLRPRRRRWCVALTLAVALVGAAFTFRRPWFAGNLDVVDPGRVYRAAQPRAGLARLVRERRLASILNLRGGSVADPWYADEVRVARDQGVDFYDFPMSATRRPTRHELLVLIDLFRRCRYPLLIHCKSGSDRTALASALYLMAARGVAPGEARGAFSVAYGHIPVGGPERLHEPLDEYDAWLRSRRLAHSPERFRHWVEREYAAGSRPVPFRPLRPGPRESLAGRPPAGGGRAVAR